MNAVKTAALMGLLMAACLFFGEILGGRQGLVLAFVFGGIGNIFAYWFSDRMILWSSGARAAGEDEVPQVYRIVRELAHSAGMPMPKVFLMETAMPNAFATGRSPSHAAVAVTTGILGMLNEDELRGVLAHELSHVRHRDILISTVAAVFAGAIVVLARWAQWAMIFGGFGGRGRSQDDSNPIAQLLTILLAPIAAMLIQMAISRSREFDADKGGVELTGDPNSLASALEKIEHAGRLRPARGVSPQTAHLFIVNPLSLKGLRRLFSTHPPTEERVARLQAMSGAAGGRGR